jgi:hypothetical protein
MPFFSVCIPQYNRTSFLIEACLVLRQQTFQDFELCISDDCSTDGRSDELRQFLCESGLTFVYRKQTKNHRYDHNLREAIALASGEYCFLMGNDDCLAQDVTLERLQVLLRQTPNVGVAISNYQSYSGGKLYRRVSRTGSAGSGPSVAASCFRNFSFVSGILLRRDRAQAHATDRWDGSEMYQMYLGCRIIGEGYDVLEVEQMTVRSGISVPGEAVDSYAAKPVLQPCPVVERRIPLVEMGRLVSDAIAPHPRSRPGSLEARVFLQILVFPYAFWILEYRRVQSWKYALGICIGMRPCKLIGELRFRVIHRLLLDAIYAVVSIAGLLAPLGLFDACQPRMYALAKRTFQPG